MIDEVQKAEKLFADPLWRLNNLYNIIDKTGKKRIFRLNWAQRELYDKMHYCNIILKARQLGVSTFVSILFLDRCLFNSNVAAGIISHTREDAEALFKKIKFAYDNLPEELKKERSANTDSARELVFNNGSSLRVGTSMRGSTFQYLHISEFGKICAEFPEKASEIITGSLNTLAPGQYVIIESTAKGRIGHFYDMTKIAQAATTSNKELSKLDFKFFFFPWWQHPDYKISANGVLITPELNKYFDSLKSDYKIDLNLEQKAWYIKKSITQGDSMMQEYPSTPEEAFFSSNEGLYYGRQMAKARTEGRIRKVFHDPNLATYVAIDIGYKDPTAIWFFQLCHQEIRLIDYYENSNEPLTHYLKIIKSKPYNISKFFAPHDAKVHEYSTGLSRADVAQQNGVTFSIAPKLEVIDGINAVRNMLDRCYFDEEKCYDGILALENYSKTWNSSMGMWGDTPLHDHASNGADAFRYLAICLPQISTSGLNLDEYRAMKRKYGIGVNEQPNHVNSILGN
jgi:hypothetical protein